MDPPTGGVECELADWDAHAAGALVAKSQDAFAVGHDDSLDSVKMGIGQNFLEMFLERKAQEQPARFAEQTAELLTTGADCWCVDNRQQFLNILHYERKEQCLVGIVQPSQE